MAESLLLYLLQSSAAIAVSGGIIMFIRKVFDRYLTAETRYRLWFLLLILAAAPFLAEAFPWLGRLTSRLAGLRTAPAGDSWQGGAPEAAGNIFTATGLLHDFSVSVSRKMPGYLAFALLSLWIGGAVLLAVLTLISAVRVNFLRRLPFPSGMQSCGTYLRTVRGNLESGGTSRFVLPPGSAPRLRRESPRLVCCSRRPGSPASQKTRSAAFCCTSFCITSIRIS